MLWLWILLTYVAVTILLVRPFFAHYTKKGFSPSVAKEKAIFHSVLWLLDVVLAALRGLISATRWVFFRDTKFMRAQAAKKAEAAQVEADLRALYHSEPHLLPEAERNRIANHIKWEAEIAKKEKKIATLAPLESARNPHFYYSELRELRDLRDSVASLREKMKA